MEFDYRTTSRYFAQVADDIKPLAAEELLSLGALEPSPVYRGVFFTADQATLYRVNLHSRLINRILAPLTSFPCPSDHVLHSRTAELPWEEFLAPDQTFAVFTAVSGSRIAHSQFAGLRLKDGVVDRFRSRTGSRPRSTPGIRTCGSICTCTTTGRPSAWTPPGARSTGGATVGRPSRRR
jgi:putative N6-adenine-specific DNA methylase